MIFDSAADHNSIAKVVQNYIDGFLGRDAELLRKTFHGNARLIAIDEGQVSESPTSDWFNSIERRRQSGDIATNANAVITGIDAAGTAAVAKVNITFPTYGFTDYLSLVKKNDEWIVVNKIYDYKANAPQ